MSQYTGHLYYFVLKQTKEVLTIGAGLSGDLWHLVPSLSRQIINRNTRCHSTLDTYIILFLNRPKKFSP